MIDLSHKLGPLPVGAWAAGGAGVLGIVVLRRRRAASTTKAGAGAGNLSAGAGTAPGAPVGDVQPPGSSSYYQAPPVVDVTVQVPGAPGSSTGPATKHAPGTRRGPKPKLPKHKTLPAPPKTPPHGPVFRGHPIVAGGGIHKLPRPSTRPRPTDASVHHHGTHSSPATGSVHKRVGRKNLRYNR